MSEHKAKKKFGQNFLRDKNLLKKIVDSAHINNQDVIEVGPGLGALTTHLCEQANTVTAFEIDLSLKPTLNKLEEKYNNLKVIYGDFLNQDIPSGEYHLVANIPYYITSSIIFRFLETGNIKSATIMIQKEVAERINAKPNQKTYNALSVILQYFCDVKKVVDAPRHMFVPKPNVDSIVIKLTKKNELPLSDSENNDFIDLVKASFKQKRKTLVNNWYESFGIPKQDIESFLANLGYDIKIRAEALSIEDFVKLSKEKFLKTNII